MFIVSKALLISSATVQLWKMYFYSRNNIINFFCYIVYFQLVLDRKSPFTSLSIYFAYVL